MSATPAQRSAAKHGVELFETVAGMRARVAAWRKDGLGIAVVPTMGFLHRAHVALIEAGQALCERVIVTIFVNPKQFGENEDFDSYPRDLDGDFAKLRAVGADAAFVPGPSEMYPSEFSSTVSVAGLTEGLCGAARPGHFDGVATVVTKLLLQAQADHAMFGEKDYQQLQMVRRLVRDLDIPVRIQAVATVREDDGLAVSSRNVRLTLEQRAAAPLLYRSLTDAAQAIAAGAAVEATAADGLARLEDGGFDRVDYFEARDAETLAPVADASRPARMFAAAWMGETRLIDNVPIGPAQISSPSKGSR